MRLLPQSAPRQLVGWLAFGGLFVWLFWPTFVWMAQRFDAADSFYSHGWLIPVASGWLIWQRREWLQRTVGRESFWGLSLLVPSLFVHVGATWWNLHFVSGFAMLTTLWGLVWMLGGWSTLSLLRFPMLFLLFTVPLPGVVLIFISFQMKLMARPWPRRSSTPWAFQPSRPAPRFNSRTCP